MTSQQTRRIPQAKASEAQSAFQVAALALNLDAAALARFEAGRAVTAEFLASFADCMQPVARANQLIASLVRLSA